MKHLAYCLFETPLGSCGIAWNESANSSTPPALPPHGAGPAPVPYGPGPAVTLLQLPEATTKMTASRIARSSGARKSSVPPPPIAEVIRKIRKHLQGELQDFRDVTVDLDGADPFARQVYEAAREIPAGKSSTYGELARALGQLALAPSRTFGSAGLAAARDVGQALARNPIPIIIPCHRVLAAGGKRGGFSAYGGRETKARLLAIEGAISGLLTG